MAKSIKMYAYGSGYAKKRIIDVLDKQFNHYHINNNKIDFVIKIL